MSAEGHKYGMAVEGEDVSVRKVFVAGLIVFGSIALVIPFLFQIVNRSVQQTNFEAAATYDSFPAIRESEMDGMRMISQYEVVDADSGVYRIPVERAMELLVQERGAVSDSVTTELPPR